MAILIWLLQSKIYRKAREVLSRSGDASNPLPDLDLHKELGLHLIHDPGPFFPVDIIFVHGFGHPRFSWCKDSNPDLFWPHQWLRLDSEITKARIFNYGYDATFRSKQPFSIRVVADDLLSEMKSNRCLDSASIGIGSVPIVFVAFSIGALVVKQAHLTGLLDKTNHEMTRQISGILFLAAPHRGTELADTMLKIFRSSSVAQKAVADMMPNSSVLELINYRFRHVAADVTIWSFYETLPSKLGMSRSVVLDVDTSTLGYPGEHSFPLAATHHDMCKYGSSDDANYLQVLGGLKRIMKQASHGSPRTLALYRPLSFAKTEV